MARESSNAKYKTAADVEKHLKSDKSFMANRSAAEFDAFVEGAMWMMKVKQTHIDKLVERMKGEQRKILELTNELAPYKELYENYEFVERRTKKTKKSTVSSDQDDEDGAMEFQEDDYGDITGEDFE